MARSRLPKDKAAVSGADAKNPQRYRNRIAPGKANPLGEPYEQMSAAQKDAWRDLARNMPWLHSAHRPLLRLVCIWVAKMDEGDIGVQASQALSSLLSKLGGTPVDQCRVSHAAPENDDPEARFFGRTH